MKRGILNAERTIFEIQHTLLTDPVISKLIYYDTPDALHREPVEDVELLKDSVLTKPIWGSGIEDFERNVVISILLPAITFGSDENNNNFEIIIMCDLSEWGLDDNKIRPLQIVNRIIELLDQRKFSTSGKLTPRNLGSGAYNKQLYGYQITFTAVDNMSSPIF